MITVDSLSKTVSLIDATVREGGADVCIYVCVRCRGGAVSGCDEGPAMSDDASEN